MKRSDWLNNNLKTGAQPVSKSGKYKGPKKTVEPEYDEFLDWSEDAAAMIAQREQQLADRRREQAMAEVRADLARRQRLLRQGDASPNNVWGRAAAPQTVDRTENEVLRERYLEAMRNSNGPFDAPQPRFSGRTS